MLLLNYIVFLGILKFKSYEAESAHTREESIILHHLRKRDLAEQLGPLPIRQTDPVPNDEDNSGNTGTGHSAGQGQGRTRTFSQGTGNNGERTMGSSDRIYNTGEPVYRQYLPTVQRENPRNPSGSGSTSHYSTPGSQTGSQFYSGQRYYPSGTGANQPTGSSSRYYTYGSGTRYPTGRTYPDAASYPLGPIISTNDGHPHYTRTQQTQYTSGQQPTYTRGQQPTYTRGQQPIYTRGQTTYTRQQQPTGGIQGGYGSYGYNTYNPSSTDYGTCPETGIRMRINGIECSRAVDHFGAFLCYRHEYTSRECCEKCRTLKNPARIGCEYGDHSYQCRQIQPFDCYDIRNRQSCCDTCERHRSTGETAGCEYGDMTPSCQRVSQDPSLCYYPENQRLCCSTCRRVRDATNPECPYGDQNANLCRPFDQYGGVRINCYRPTIRRICCQTCDRLRSRMPENIPGTCQYGDRPVIFNTGLYGSLNCTSFFRHFPVDQCTLNEAVSINCCYTCFRYQGHSSG